MYRTHYEASHAPRRARSIVRAVAPVAGFLAAAVGLYVALVVVMSF